MRKSWCMQSQNRPIQSVTYGENFCSYQQYKQSKSTLQGTVEPQQIFQNYREDDNWTLKQSAVVQHQAKPKEYSEYLLQSLPRCDLTMQVVSTEAILKFAQTINPQINPEREFSINLEALRQLPEGTLGREVARFLDENGFDPLNSGDWIQRTHDVWHVLTGLSPSEHDELVLQAFTRAQVFRPSCAILAIAGLLTRKCNFTDIIQGLNSGKLAKPLIDWDIESDWATPLTEVRKKLGIEPLN